MYVDIYIIFFIFIYLLTHQIFPGSRPWYIMARMRQDGLRTVTVFSYLENKKAQQPMTWITARRRTLSEAHRGCIVTASDSLLLFLLDVLILSVFSLISECRAVVHKLLDDFL